MERLAKAKDGLEIFLAVVVESIFFRERGKLGRAKKRAVAVFARVYMKPCFPLKRNMPSTEMWETIDVMQTYKLRP